MSSSDLGYNFRNPILQYKYIQIYLRVIIPRNPEKFHRRNLMKGCLANLSGGSLAVVTGQAASFSKNCEQNIHYRLNTTLFLRILFYLFNIFSKFKIITKTYNCNMSHKKNKISNLKKLD